MNVYSCMFSSHFNFISCSFLFYSSHVFVLMKLNWVLFLVFLLVSFLLFRSSYSPALSFLLPFSFWCNYWFHFWFFLFSSSLLFSSFPLLRYFYSFRFRFDVIVSSSFYVYSRGSSPLLFLFFVVISLRPFPVFCGRESGGRRRRPLRRRLSWRGGSSWCLAASLVVLGKGEAKGTPRPLAMGPPSHGARDGALCVFGRALACFLSFFLLFSFIRSLCLFSFSSLFIFCRFLFFPFPVVNFFFSLCLSTTSSTLTLPHNRATNNTDLDASIVYIVNFVLYYQYAIRLLCDVLWSWMLLLKYQE